MKISDFVLAVEMKNIDRFASVFEMLVEYSTLMSVELAIIVEDEIFWGRFRRRECRLRKQLPLY